MTEELRNDRAFAIEAVKRNGAALKFLLPKFQADVEIVQAAVARDPRAASHAHASRRHELGLEGESALGETHLAKEYAAQAEAGQAKAQKDEAHFLHDSLFHMYRESMVFVLVVLVTS